MKKQKVFYGWWVVLGCIVITCTMVPLIMSLSNKFLIQITEELNITRSAFTLANTILQSLGIFLSPIVARKLAKGNMRKIQSFSIIGFVLAYGSYAFAQNVFHLYISAFLVGIFYLNATLIPVSMMITNWFIKKRGLAMSLAMSGIGLGGVIFSPVVTFFLTNYGWRKTYLFMALIVLILALPTALFILKKKPEDMGLQAYGRDEEEANIKKSTKVSQGLLISTEDSKKKVFFWIILFAMLTNGIINSGSLGHFPPALEEMHGPTVQAAIISLYSFIGIFGKLAIGWIDDKFGTIVSTTVGCVTFALAFVFMLLGTNATLLYPMALFFGLGNAIGTVTPPLITSAVFGADRYGEVYGIVNSATQVGLSIGSLFIASIYDASGSYTAAWIILFVITIITYSGWICSYVLSRKYSDCTTDKREASTC